MTSAQQTFVIVGASLAGAKAAETLRSEGFDGEIVLIGEEPDHPYERPSLSKAFLRGESGADEAFVHGEGFYRENDVTLRVATSVNAIDVKQRTVCLEGRAEIRYDALLLATGSRARRLSVPGADLAGIHYLRTLRDAHALRDAVSTATRVAVVGAGWIGSEVAASIRQRDVAVSVIDPGEVPLRHVLGPEVGAVYRDLHVEHGVEFHLGSGVDAFVGDSAVEGVRTSDGVAIPADLVVVGVGAEPRVELARAAGLDVDGGIAVDPQLETSVPGVFAAGDVAAAFHPLFGRRIRVEHWANALNQGVTAAKNMLGTHTPYERIPYFFSDQYDLGMEYSGYAPTWDRVIFRGDPSTREFIALYVRDDKVVAALNANVWDVTESLQALIRNESPADDARLADLNIPLDDLVTV